MFVSDAEDGFGFPTTYAHCEGCGMEYELSTETGVLNYWHDGVGLVKTTTLPGPNDWDKIVASHADHKEV